MTDASEIEPAWFPDPVGAYSYRWWDGSAWTDWATNGDDDGIHAPLTASAADFGSDSESEASDGAQQTDTAVNSKVREQSVGVSASGALLVDGSAGSESGSSRSSGSSEWRADPVGVHPHRLWENGAWSDWIHDGQEPQYVPMATEPATASVTNFGPAPQFEQAAWHADPSGRATYRWWDGYGWTDSVSNGGTDLFSSPLRPVEASPTSAESSAAHATNASFDGSGDTVLEQPTNEVTEPEKPDVGRQGEQSGPLGELTAGPSLKGLETGRAGPTNAAQSQPSAAKRAKAEQRSAPDRTATGDSEPIALGPASANKATPDDTATADDTATPGDAVGPDDLVTDRSQPQAADLEGVRADGWHGIQRVVGRAQTALTELRRAKWTFDDLRSAPQATVDEEFGKYVERHASDPSVRLPLPEDLEGVDAPLLRASARRLRSQEIPDRLASRVDQTAEALGGMVKDIRTERRKQRRRGPSDIPTERASARADTIEQILEHPEFIALREEVGEAMERAAVPESFPELAEEYGERFADYGSILEDTIARVGGTVDAVIEFAQGGLPRSVVRRIEAIELDIAGLDIRLRNYQRFGIQFAIEQKRVVLGDEMGLGKTIQALGAITHAANAEGATRFAIVVPASILASWIHEIDLRSDHRLFVVHGSQKHAAMAEWLREGGIAITTYSTLRGIAGLDEIAVDMLVADECHYVKNPDAQQSRATADLARHAKRALLMSGTPLENNVGEMEHIISIVDPEIARSIAAHSGSGTAFRNIIAPVYLRRNQADVLKELPEKIEIEEWVDLSEEELLAHTHAVRNRNIMGMRQAAVVGAGPDSTKLDRLAELLAHYRQDGQKVIVFSNFLGVLNEIERTLDTSHRIDGSVSVGAARQQVLDEFQGEEGHAVLLSQINSGGVGLNIQAASVVILMEPQFKPTTEWQAIARAHRLGQTRRVTVHRLLARGCVEETLHSLVGTKTETFDAYARESELKDASSAAVDAGLKNQLLDRETNRLKAA